MPDVCSRDSLEIRTHGFRHFFRSDGRNSRMMGIIGMIAEYRDSHRSLRDGSSALELAHVDALLVGIGMWILSAPSIALAAGASVLVRTLFGEQAQNRVHDWLALPFVFLAGYGALFLFTSVYALLPAIRHSTGCVRDRAVLSALIRWMPFIAGAMSIAYTVDAA